MGYIVPDAVISPKANWTLVDVVLSRGEGAPAYAIGMWDGRKCVGFRWNGTKQLPLGNPQSRGLPTWTILDEDLNAPVLRLVQKLNPSKANIMGAFLDLPLKPLVKFI